MQGLFGVYGLDLPELLGDLPDENDTLPSNLNLSTISYVGGLLSTPLVLFLPNPCVTVKLPDDGEGFNIRQTYTQSDDQEATSVETFILRFDTEDTPSGRFPVYLNKTLPHADFAPGHVIGYDAAVCIQRYEPWMIEAYNTSIASPSALRIIGKGTRSTPLSPSGNIQGAPVDNTRYLNTTGKVLAFGVAYTNSINKMVKEITRETDYLPSPTVGPPLPPRTAFLLTSTYSAGRFFYRRRWTLRIHRTLQGPARSHPRTDWCSLHSTIRRGVWTRRRTIIQG